MSDSLNSNIEEYQFQSFTNGDGSEAGEAQEYSFQDLSNKIETKIDSTRQIKISKERDFATKNNFRISPIVREHRGLIKQERDELETRFQDEVEARVAKLEEKAFKQGFEDGAKKGREEVFNQTRASTEEKLVSLSVMISDVLKTYEDIIGKQKAQIFEIVRNLTKWVILRELKDDDKYVERLLEKLIVELSEKNNLLVLINQKEFETMPEVLETVQKRVGELPNVRVEIDYDIGSKGIILESENGIIDGTISQQFKSLDRLFESVGIFSEEKTSDTDTEFVSKLEALSSVEDVAEVEEIIEVEEQLVDDIESTDENEIEGDKVDGEPGSDGDEEDDGESGSDGDE